MTTVDYYISNRIKELREKRGITQQQLSELLGFKSRISVQNMESGKQVVLPSTIYLLCSIFNIKPTDIFPEVVNATFKIEISGLPKITTHDK